jgi:hypothetical protein
LKHIALLLFALASASLSHAATVTSQTNCEVYDGAPWDWPFELAASQTRAFDCDLRELGSRAWAQTFYYMSLEGATAQLAVSTYHEAGIGSYALPGPPEDGGFLLYTSHGAANASIALRASVGTGGPVRNGIMRYTFDYFGSASNIGASASFSSPYLSGGCSFFPYDRPGCGVTGQSVTVPFPAIGEVVVPLGRDMDFLLSSFAAGGGGSASGASIGLTLNFFEMDGTTPVLLAPEPSTWLLSGSVIALLAFVPRRRTLG